MNIYGKQKFVFLGRQTITDDRRVLFQQMCSSMLFIIVLCLSFEHYLPVILSFLSTSCRIRFRTCCKLARPNLCSPNRQS